MTATQPPEDDTPETVKLLRNLWGEPQENREWTFTVTSTERILLEELWEHAIQLGLEPDIGTSLIG